jgi:type II secretory pathway component GspD/PulD (secretin)
MAVKATQVLLASLFATRVAAQRIATPVTDLGDSVTIHLVDVDLRVAVSALAPYLDHPVVFGAVPALRVTLETPRPVPRGEIARLLTGVVESQNLQLALDTATGLYRVRAHEAPAVPPQPISTNVGKPGGELPQL